MQERLRRKPPAITPEISVQVEQEVTGPATPDPGTPDRSPGVGFNIGTISILAPEETHSLANFGHPPSIQRATNGPGAAPGLDLASRIQSASRTGRDLDGSTRGSLEQGLGADLSGVRVHDDAESDQLARSIHAQAFTTGQNIFFRSGAYEPGNQAGKHLLAHEAAHTVQQATSPVAPTATEVAINEPGDAFEQEADQAADSVLGDSGGQSSLVQRQRIGGVIAPLRHGAAEDTARTPLLIQRAPDEETSKRLDAADAKQKILEKRIKFLELDNEWRGKFMGVVADREKAMFRITGGLDAASAGFLSTQQSQAQMDALKVQLIGGLVSIGFAYGFEWAFSNMLGSFGKEASVIEDLVEKWENPANATVSSAVNTAGPVQAMTNTAEGAMPAQGSALAYLAANGAAIKGHVKGFEEAFGKRSASMKNASDDDWAKADIKTQENQYTALFDALDKSGKPEKDLKSDAELALIFERHLWALWIQGLRNVELASKEAAKEAGSGPLDLDETKAEANYSTLGSEVEARLNKIGVASAAGVRLSEWSIIPNSTGYKQKLLDWASTYGDKIGSGTAPPKG